MKRPKKKGMRRAYLKQWSSGMINGPQRIDKRYVDQFKGNAGSMGRMPKGGMPIEFQTDGSPLLPKIIHQHEMPKPRSHITEAGHYIPGATPKRRETELKMREEVLAERMRVVWQANPRLQNWKTMPRVKVFSSHMRQVTIWMYYNSYDCFIFIEEGEKQFRASLTYTSRDRAMYALSVYKSNHLKGISWVEVQDRVD